MKASTKRKKSVTIDVSDADYRREIESGLDQESALKPGRHVFRRGGFKSRHPGFEASKTPVKVRVNIYLDLDIVNFFKARAKSRDAARYQTQINNALRTYIDHLNQSTEMAASLVKDNAFIAAIAKRVAGIRH